VPLEWSNRGKASSMVLIGFLLLLQVVLVYVS
jgi:hypothetical protein